MNTPRYLAQNSMWWWEISQRIVLPDIVDECRLTCGRAINISALKARWNWLSIDRRETSGWDRFRHASVSSHSRRRDSQQYEWTFTDISDVLTVTKSVHCLSRGADGSIPFPLTSNYLTKVFRRFFVSFNLHFLLLTFFVSSPLNSSRLTRWKTKASKELNDVTEQMVDSSA